MVLRRTLIYTGMIDAAPDETYTYHSLVKYLFEVYILIYSDFYLKFFQKSTLYSALYSKVIVQ